MFVLRERRYKSLADRTPAFWHLRHYIARLVDASSGLTSDAAATMMPVTTRRDELKEQLAALITQGETLLFSEQLRRASDEEVAAALARADAAEGGTKNKSSKAKKPTVDRSKLPSLADEYQSWYSRALAVIDQLLRDRASEFRELYRHERPPKELTWMTYTVSDYLSGTVVYQWGNEKAFDNTRAGLDRFGKQVAILASAQDRLHTLLADITGVLEAEIFDDELAAALALLAAKHRRSAGVVAGVVLERHLKRLIANHQVSFRKKPMLGNLNEALKTAGVYDVPQWRQIQRLTDIRNLCGHDAEREPTIDEVDELIRGVQKIVSTVF